MSRTLIKPVVLKDPGGDPGYSPDGSGSIALADPGLDANLPSPDGTGGFERPVAWSPLDTLLSAANAAEFSDPLAGLRPPAATGENLAASDTFNHLALQADLANGTNTATAPDPTFLREVASLGLAHDGLQGTGPLQTAALTPEQAVMAFCAMFREALESQGITVRDSWEEEVGNFASGKSFTPTEVEGVARALLDTAHERAVGVPGGFRQSMPETVSRTFNGLGTEAHDSSTSVGPAPSDGLRLLEDELEPRILRRNAA